MIITAIFLTGIPVSADTGTTLSDRIVTAITGNNNNTKLSNIDSKLSTLNTNITNLITAVNNSGGGGTGSGIIKAKCITASNNVTLNGSGFIIITPQVMYTGTMYESDFPNYYSYASLKLDGINQTFYCGFSSLNADSSGRYPLTVYYAESASISKLNCCTATIYKYI